MQTTYGKKSILLITERLRRIFIANNWYRYIIIMAIGSIVYYP